MWGEVLVIEYDYCEDHNNFTTLEHIGRNILKIMHRVYIIWEETYNSRCMKLSIKLGYLKNTYDSAF